MRVCSYRSCGLGEDDVVNLRLELGVESSAVETERVLVVLRMLKQQKRAVSVKFLYQLPMSLQK